MADKETKLSIVIRTVDRATAGIRAISSQLDRMTKPARDAARDASKGISSIASTLGEMGKSIWDSFGKVGGAIKNALKDIAVVGGIVIGTIGGAVAAVVHLVDKFSDLGKAATRLGVGVDYLADLRYAAEKTGVPMEALDQSLLTFSENLGQARAGTGRMQKFLERVYPPLLAQLKAAHSNAEAFSILADAMSKLQDPAKRSALARKTLGDAALAPLLARGADGVLALSMEHQKLTGSLEGATAASEDAHASMVELRAAIDGAEAGIVVGLAPALKVIVKRLSEWFVEHRADIAEWAKKIGDELPGAVDKVVDAIKAAIAWIQKAAEEVGKLLDKLGGLENILDTLSAGRKILSFGKNFSLVGDAGSLSDDESGPSGIAQRMRDRYIERPEAQVDTSSLFGGGADVSAQAGNAVAGADGAHARAAQMVADALAGHQVSVAPTKITVDFANAPRGTRVSSDSRSGGPDVDLNVGYQTLPGLP